MERREPTAVTTADAAGLGADEQLRLDYELLQARPLASFIHSLVPKRITPAAKTAMLMVAQTGRGVATHARTDRHGRIGASK